MVESQQVSAAAPRQDMEGEALDEGTQQTLDFINQIEDSHEEDANQRSGSDVQGLKVTTFGALHRESEAKKFVIKLPNLNQVLDTVNFEIQSLPDDFQEALQKCQQTKELIYDSYKQQLDNHLMGKSEENKSNSSATSAQKNNNVIRRLTE